MGLIAAKMEEEEAQYRQSLARGAVYAMKCMPEYVTEPILLGLAPAGFMTDDEGDPYNDFHMTHVEEEEDEEEGGVQLTKEDLEMKRRIADRVSAEHKKLFEGCARGWYFQVSGALRQSATNVNAQDKYGRTALYLAAERGNPRCMGLLMEQHARADLKTANGWAPLHAAAFNGHVACMEVLLKSGENVNVETNNKVTPFMMAVSSPKLYILDLIRKKHRRRLRKLREEAFREQMRTEAREASGVLQRARPEELWMYFPNRVELIVMEILLRTRQVKIDQQDSKKRTALIYAARLGRLFAMSRLLAARADLRKSDKDGHTPLMAAACNEMLEAAELLLRAGASVTVQDEFLRTPLHGALETGNEAMAQLLLKADASVNAFDCQGRTPILLAMDKKNRRLFKEILDRRSNLDVLDQRGWNVVIYAIETGMLPEMAPLLQRLGAKVRPVIRARDPQGRNAMHHATALPNASAASKSVEVVAEIDSDAAIYGDCNGDTAIHMAVELGRLEVMRLLLQGKESADYLNNRGETPLHYAAHGGHIACFVSLIRDRGKGRGPLCDAGAVDNLGRGILHHACVPGHLDLVNLILGAREGGSKDLILPHIDVNGVDLDGVAPLSIAAREGHWHLLPSLVLAGANLASRDKDGFTALHWAAADDEPFCVRCLLDLGLDANTVDKTGWTPLMHAACQGSDEAIRVLIDSSEADLNATNFDGDTALKLCMRRKDAPELVAITKDLITDGFADADIPKDKSIEARGYLNVSVLDAMDLYIEGKLGELNTYVCLMFRAREGAAPLVSFTTCVLSSPSPEWHETFRFDLDSIDSTAVLVAWVIAAPGEDAGEVLEATQLVLSEEAFGELRDYRVSNNIALPPRKPPMHPYAINTAFERATKKADRAADREVDRIRQFELAQSSGVEPTMDLAVPATKDSSGLLARRWAEIDNFRATFARSGCEVHEPLVPRSHLPVGCVVARFRQLRSAVWGAEAVIIDRTLRLNTRGRMRIDLDFRPRFFEAMLDPRAGPRMTAEEEDALYDVHHFDIRHESAEHILGTVERGVKKKKGAKAVNVRRGANRQPGVGAGGIAAVSASSHWAARGAKRNM